MFTGIIQAVARIAAIDELPGLRTFTLDFPPGFCQDLAIGASVATDGVCLTVTELLSPTQARFDVMQQTLAITTLGSYAVGQRVNVERAAREGAEVGGHILSGHVDGTSTLLQVVPTETNYKIRFELPPALRPYVFAKGYIAINGASLTVAEADRQEGWFEVWLIPETRRMTVFEDKHPGDRVNIEIERSTQVIVDTVRDTVAATLGPLRPALEALLAEKGLTLDDFVTPSQAATRA
jgi:riboflavin synthase